MSGHLICEASNIVRKGWSSKIGSTVLENSKFENYAACGSQGLSQQLFTLIVVILSQTSNKESDVICILTVVKRTIYAEVASFLVQ